ncbi:hypothetical protein ILYODFUR_030676 [Ilyodon furcidens]|uniref:Secreted protein n=1 Tax=Ilyodon furcidens TaxID=33524 RepID=A0ABV0V0E8_9TELE
MVPVFVSGWVLGCSLSWISLGPQSNVGPISSPPHYLPVAGGSTHWCTCGSRCLGWVLWYVLAHSQWLFAGAWAPGFCWTSARGVMCPGVLVLWVHGWICSGVMKWIIG